jgi:hypothetical protein
MDAAAATANKMTHTKSAISLVLRSIQRPPFARIEFPSFYHDEKGNTTGNDIFR